MQIEMAWKNFLTFKKKYILEKFIWTKWHYAHFDEYVFNLSGCG